MFSVIFQISASKPGTLVVGARLPRAFRFDGEIVQIIFFNSVISAPFVNTLINDSALWKTPKGQCVAYKEEGDTCPTPVAAPSLLCQSSKDRYNIMGLLLAPIAGSAERGSNWNC